MFLTAFFKKIGHAFAHLFSGVNNDNAHKVAEVIRHSLEYVTDFAERAVPIIQLVDNVTGDHIPDALPPVIIEAAKFLGKTIPELIESEVDFITDGNKLALAAAALKIDLINEFKVKGKITFGDVTFHTVEEIEKISNADLRAAVGTAVMLARKVQQAAIK